MREIYLTVILLVFYTTLYSQQNSELKYYKNSNRSRVVNKEEAKFVEETQFFNEIKRVEFRRVRNQKILWIKEYRKEDASGDWELMRSYDSYGKLNYVSSLYGANNPENYFVIDLTKDLLNQKFVDGFICPQFTDARYISLKEGMERWIREKVRYPVEAQERYIQGEVWVQFIIDEFGHVGNVRIAKGVDDTIDRAAVETILELARFVPAKLNGEAVGVCVVVPIKFTLC